MRLAADPPDTRTPAAPTENDSGSQPRSSGRTSRCPAHQSTGCSVTRSRRRPAPSSAVTISPSVHARANFRCWSSSGIDSRSMYSGAQPRDASAPREVVVVGEESSRPSASASNSHSAGWPSKITSRPSGARSRRSTAAQASRSWSHRIAPAARVQQVGGAVEVVRRVEDVRLDPSRGSARRGGQAPRELEHPRAEVHADDLVRAERSTATACRGRRRTGGGSPGGNGRAGRR